MTDRNPRPKFDKPIMQDDPVCEAAEREGRAIKWMKDQLFDRRGRRKHRHPDFRDRDRYWGQITSRRP